jgi:limonene-1,2-epoxide hydrolase
LAFSSGAIDNGPDWVIAVSEDCMDMADLLVTRRTLFLAGGLGAIAIAAAKEANAVDVSAVEKANVQLVKDFCKAWADDPPDCENMANRFLAEDCVVRFGETIAPVTGQVAAAALFQSFLGSGQRYDLKILETFAHGPIVVNSRMDSTIRNSRSIHPTPVVGVFYIKDGKIKEWSDYG